MPVVLIHGVPDTHRLWAGVLRHLRRTDVLAWDLPGFGSPRPDNFTSTKEEYVRWLTERIEALGEPVDLVGHGWGCMLTARVASLRPDLVRTWAGGNGPISARYDWHTVAKIWQDPIVGDQFMATLDEAAFAGTLHDGFDVPADLAREAVARMDPVMRDSILRLYRSAVTVGADWEPGLAGLTSPALVFWGTRDPAVPAEFGRELGELTRATRVAELDCNHWTVLERPAEVAALLTEHFQFS
ncbi:alpha/beta fold hydrolase [Actinoplanes derwentensis]|uniref:Pimeloyl-ACP methyl ester carboxylesterase n=1 Tax=Actinoplanes derwentensis TaxID=113562 RepID=A0A1H1RVJ9_9ACTN|nr:alpha/beta hydrolase [Actinoplanes derwentensis]GID84533.1 oxidoreductase [Actinoplanes derwentensis]SDS39714.1 Pimeloyl-ACP methyl ester carboxylesterase [Actinoplanes derwentensis]